MFRRPRKEIGPHPSQGVWLPDGRWERWAPHNPNIEIQLLRLETPRIYGPEVDRLCLSSSKNFVGALFYATHQEYFLRRLMEESYESDANFALDNDAAIAFRLLREVPLYTYDKVSRRHQALPQTAPLVLFKQASGPNSGVIIQGPYSGIILDTYDSMEDPTKGMTINRVWNDELIHEHNTPYPLHYSTMDTLLREPAKEPLRFEYQQKFLESLKKEGFRVPVWTTTLFFHFCQKLGIPLDTQNFYYLRSKEAINEKLNPRHTR